MLRTFVMKAWQYIPAGSVFWLLLFSVARASGAHLSLSQAIETAKTHNPERLVLVAQKEATEARASQALAPTSPTFALGFGDLAAPPGPETSNLRTYQLSQSLGFPGKASASSESLNRDAEAIGQEIQLKDLEITREVKNFFYRLSLSQQKLTLNELRRTSYGKILAAAKRRFVKNTTTEVEYLNASLALKRIDNDQIDLMASERSALKTLNVLLGNSPDAALSITPELLTDLLEKKIDGDALRRQFLNSSPSLALYRKRVEAAQSRVTEARRAYLPDFRLSAGKNNLNAYSGLVEVSLPVWFWWSERVGVNSASSSVTAREAELQAQRLNLQALFEDKLSLLQAVQEKLNNYQNHLIPTSQKAFEVALRNYHYGKIDYATLVASTDASVNSRVERETLLSEGLGLEAEIDELLGNAGGTP